MSHHPALTLWSAAILLLPVATGAADFAPAQRIPVENFATPSQLAMPRLSPDDNYLALRVDDRNGDQHALDVYRVEDMTHPVSMLRMPKYELPV
jgi:hypothetical protein